MEGPHGVLEAWARYVSRYQEGQVFSAVST